jgi:predicted nuclease with TOPRIM domain
MSEELRSQAEILAAIAEAREDLTTGLADLQATVEELNSRPLLTDEEKQALEEQAESGELGEDMRTLVGKIKDGEDTWEQVFSGESPHGSLLQGHLTRMFEEHKEDIALAFEELIEAEEAKGNFIFDEVPTNEA